LGRSYLAAAFSMKRKHNCMNLIYSAEMSENWLIHGGLGSKMKEMAMDADFSALSVAVSSFALL